MSGQEKRIARCWYPGDMLVMSFTDGTWRVQCTQLPETVCGEGATEDEAWNECIEQARLVFSHDSYASVTGEYEAWAWAMQHKTAHAAERFAERLLVVRRKEMVISALAGGVGALLFYGIARALAGLV